MTVQHRIRRYAQLATAAAILVFALLCFFLLISPRAGKLRRVEADLEAAHTQLADMRKEIENASIAGMPAPGESRYEKFGILGADEEQLFLSDLIDFCTETDNTLNVVRRADIARAASTTDERPSPSGGPKATPNPQEPAVPQPKIERVPHTVNFSGTFLSSFHLLRTLEGYKRLLTVERVELAANTREGYPRVNGNISIDLYLVKNAGQPLPGAPEPAQTDGTVAAKVNSQPSQETRG
jgi:hypothetical protein